MSDKHFWIIRKPNNLFGTKPEDQDKKHKLIYFRARFEIEDTFVDRKWCLNIEDCSKFATEEAAVDMLNFLEAYYGEENAEVCLAENWFKVYDSDELDDALFKKQKENI